MLDFCRIRRAQASRAGFQPRGTLPGLPQTESENVPGYPPYAKASIIMLDSHSIKEGGWSLLACAPGQHARGTSTTACNFDPVRRNKSRIR